MLRVAPSEIQFWQIVKKSIDARKKPEISIVYSLDVAVASQKKVLAKCRNKCVQAIEEKGYKFPVTGKRRLHGRPIIIGTGPAGLFCGYLLARHGYKPLLLERGNCVEKRLEDVERFWREGILNPSSNVQFGEGGAGTFSDGKLNTLVKDKMGRNREVLRIFVEAGAPEQILYEAKPHIGTDILVSVVRSLRRQIVSWGGEVRFGAQVTELIIEEGHVSSVVVNQEEAIECETVVLAIGHSARDTFEMLYQRNIPMEAKSFAVGLRMEHPRKMIDLMQYGCEEHPLLPAANYKVTAQTSSGRGVYSFCMCPGGYVVNASSEEGQIATNGMSYSARDGKNANSAIIVTVTPEDFGAEGPLAGVQFQRSLEKKAFELGKGKVPQQLFGDFERKKLSETYGSFTSEIKGLHEFGALHELFPEEIRESFCQGMHKFAHRIAGFDREDAILSGVESRTSSPVRITRDEEFESNRKGIYPCGEGAGYAGGIMSAAMDGMKVAEAIAKKYKGGD